MSDHIPLEIQGEIIKKLPIKLVVQCRSVSKSWKSLIDSSKFITAYTTGCRAQPQHLLISYQVADSEETTYVSIADDDTFPHNKYSVTVPPSVNRLKDSIVVGTSHGLVCLSGYYRSPGDNRLWSGKKTAVIWNPSIRKSVAIDMPSNEARTALGFGVCPKTCDPTIIYITHDMHGVTCGSRWQVEVFTLSSQVWRRSYGNLPSNSVKLYGPCSSVNIDGSINWLVGNTIVSFDLSNEEFTEMCLPDDLLCIESYFLFNRNDSLALATMDVMEDMIFINVLVMENGDSGSFISRFSYNIPYEFVDKVGFPLEFRRNGEVLMVMLDVYDNSAVLLAYAPFSEQLNEVGIKGYSTTVNVSSYAESLILLDRFEALDDYCLSSYLIFKIYPFSLFKSYTLALCRMLVRLF